MQTGTERLREPPKACVYTSESLEQNVAVRWDPQQPAKTQRLPDADICSGCPRATRPLQAPSDTFHYPTQKTFYQELGPAAQILVCAQVDLKAIILTGELGANSPFSIGQALKLARSQEIDQRIDPFHTESSL